jgi:hypothetical protein
MQYASEQHKGIFDHIDYAVLFLGEEVTTARFL